MTCSRTPVGFTVSFLSLHIAQTEQGCLGGTPGGLSSRHCQSLRTPGSLASFLSRVCLSQSPQEPSHLLLPLKCWSSSLSGKLLTVLQSPWAPDAPFALCSLSENPLNSQGCPECPPPLGEPDDWVDLRQETWDRALFQGWCVMGSPAGQTAGQGTCVLGPSCSPLSTSAQAPGTLAGAGGGTWRLRAQALMQTLNQTAEGGLRQGHGAAEARAVGGEHRGPFTFMA